MTSTTRYLRSLLILGRVSNLPTVWSNCLAGWWMTGAGDLGHFLLLCLGGTLLYLGGMFLNDAFDAQFDLQHRPERPIPSGAIRVEAVWQWGVSWLALGLLCFGLLGLKPFTLALLLVVCILIYDAIHKIFAFSPFLMAACRFFLVLAAAAVGQAGITGLSIWSALVLAGYIVGLSFLAQRETLLGPLRYWPVLFLGAPLVLALIVNRGEYLNRGLVFAALLTVWIIRCLRYAYWAEQRNVGLAIAGLLAGIVLVDLLAVAGGTVVVGLCFVALFTLSLLLQRFIPAT